MFKHNGAKENDSPIYGVIDERTKTIANQGDAYTSRFMVFALLLDVILRSFHIADSLTSSNWDLMLIVIIGTSISTVFQIKSKIMFNRPFARSIVFVAFIMGLSAAIAFLANKLN